jgi:hypothetical protein
MRIALLCITFFSVFGGNSLLAQNSTPADFNEMMDRSHKATQEAYASSNLEFIRSLCESIQSAKVEQDNCVANHEYLKSGDFFRIPINICKPADDAASKIKCYKKAVDALKKFSGNVVKYTRSCSITSVLSNSKAATCFDDEFFKLLMESEKQASPPPKSDATY